MLSAVVPGAGQLFAGRRRRGWLLIGSTLVITIPIVALIVVDPIRVVKLAFDPGVLIALLVANLAVLIFRVWASIDAYRLEASSSLVSAGVATQGVITLIALVLVVPHAFFTYYDVIQYDLITEVFADPTTTTTTASTTTVPTTTVPATTGPTATGPGPSAVTTTIPTTTTTTMPPAVWDGLERLNVLLLGGDSGVGRTGVRTDTMILASIDPETADLALFSVPRNFARVPLPPEVGIWDCDCFPPILNELYQYGEQNPESFPGSSTPGGNAIKGAFGELLGLEIHFFALVDLQGFVDLVDAIGGVTITVTERVYDPSYPSVDGGTEVIDFQPGVYEMNGYEALAYARSRRSSDDYNRMGRQRCVIEAVVDQADPFRLLRSFPTIADVLKDTLVTDIPLDAVPDLIELAAEVDTDEALSLRLIPPTYVGGRTADGYNIPDVDLIREHAAIATSLPPDEAREVLGIDPLADICE